MKNTLLLVMAAFIFLAAGCAGTTYSLLPDNQGNRMVYTQKDTGQKITVEIDPDFARAGKRSRTRNGVRVDGYLFSGDPGEIFVARLLVSDFEKITGLDVPEITSVYKEFPAGTFYNEVYCNLVRARAVVMGDEIVVAALKKILLDQHIPCATIDSLEELSERYPELVREVESVADRSIRIGVH